MRRGDKPPLFAAIVVYTSRAALGIAMGATLVMVAFAVGKMIGYPMHEHGLGDAALSVLFVAMGVYAACAWFGWLADRKRGLR